MTAQAPRRQPLDRAGAPAAAPHCSRSAAILLAALALRLWNLDHGLPFAYNADEAEHFVPRAVEMPAAGLDPGYYENPPALTYLLYAILRSASSAGAIGATSRPTGAFLTARVVVALIGTLVVGAHVLGRAARLFGAASGSSPRR